MFTLLDGVFLCSPSWSFQWWGRGRGSESYIHPVRLAPDNIPASIQNSPCHRPVLCHAQSFSHVRLCNPTDCSPPGSSVHGDSPSKNTRVACYAFLQGIFLTQGLNPGLSHCRGILYCLSYQESPRILEWVAYPFSRGSSQPRNQTRVSCISGRFFTS